MQTFITSIVVKKREIIRKFNSARKSEVKRAGNNKVGKEFAENYKVRVLS